MYYLSLSLSLMYPLMQPFKFPCVASRALSEGLRPIQHLRIWNLKALTRPYVCL